MNISRNSSKRLPGSCRLALPLSLITASIGVVAQSLDSHVHGEAELNVVMNEQQLQVEFISPAMNLLGFERAPSSDEETGVLNEVIDDLLKGRWLLGDAMTGCEVTTMAFEAPEYDNASHEHDEHEHDEHEHEEHEHEEHEHGDANHDHEGEEAVAHADFRVEYLYECTAMPAREITVSAFDNYSGIEKITVQWVTESEQGYAELTPENPILSLQ